jgi:hypothetical protein
MRNNLQLCRNSLGERTRRGLRTWDFGRVLVALILHRTFVWQLGLCLL